MMRSQENTGGTIDVLLAYPADPVRLFDSMVPLGLASIAAVLEANANTCCSITGTLLCSFQFGKKHFCELNMDYQKTN
jgi:hypothetical protein